MNTQFVSTISEEPSWLMSNLWWLALVGIVVLTIIWGGSKAILAGMIWGIIQLLPPTLDQSTPEATALGYAQAMAKFDIATAKRYAEPEAARKVLAAMEGLIDQIPQETKDKALEDGKNLRSARCIIRGDRATCNVCCDANGKEGDNGVSGAGTGTFYEKIDGKWYVGYSKEASPNSEPPMKRTPESTPNQ